MKTLRGKISGGKDIKIAIVLSLFNEFIGQKLLEGALKSLKENNVDDNNIDIVKVPGAFEIPLAAEKLASLRKYDSILCLGAVIRGETPHFDYVADAASSGILQVSLKYSLPIAFGVLTTNNVEQAVERAGGKHGNKGYDIAITALEMADLMKKIKP
jgi:6,7-dimethyl-8-ribityllumazine synthase